MNMYDLLVTDMMDTLTSTRDTVGKQHAFILGSEAAQRAIVAELGPEHADVEKVLAAGMASYKAGNKDTAEFRRMILASDIGGKIGYQSGALQMELFPEIAEALTRVNDAGCRVIVYSSGDVEVTGAAIKSAGIDSLVDGYYSTANTGSKSDPLSYRTIADNEGVDVGRAIYVADSIKECEGALEAGYRSLLIDRKAQSEDLGEKGGHLVIDNYHKVADEIVKPDNTQEKNASPVEA